MEEEKVCFKRYSYFVYTRFYLFFMQIKRPFPRYGLLSCDGEIVPFSKNLIYGGKKRREELYFKRKKDQKKNPVAYNSVGSETSVPIL